MSAAGLAVLPLAVGAPGPLDAPDAACLSVPADVMHPVAGPGLPGKAYLAAVATAQAVCARCPSLTHARCRDYALAWPGELSGVWAGIAEHELNAMKREGRSA